MFLQDKVADIDKKLEILVNVKNVVIWGAGIHTNKLFEKTRLCSYDIEDIVDIDETKQGEVYFGFVIKNPKKIIWNRVGAVVISVPNREKQIVEKLINELRFENNIITLYEENDCTPFYRLYDKRKSQICYLGDYDSWGSAYSECKGYSDDTIISKVVCSVTEVLNGNAEWERDGCLFYEKKYNHQICSIMLKCALCNENRGIRVLDIGGSLGSTYFQNRAYLADIKGLEYVIMEQDNFVDYGHRYLENDELKFVRGKDYAEVGNVNIVLMSASLQYISEYKEIITEILEVKPNYIILDRILVSDRERICKEIVPKEIYNSSYPVRIFDKKEIKKWFGKDYQIVDEDISSVPEEVYFKDGKAESQYYVFQKYLSESRYE